MNVGSWTITDLRSEVGYLKAIGFYASIALDSSGKPHISAHSETLPNKGVYYFWYNGGWNYELVEESGDRGQYTSMGLDSLDNPRIAYYDDDNNRLRYAYKNAGVWFFNVLAWGVNDVGSYASLAFEGDNPRIASIDRTNTKVVYHKKNGGWGASEPCSARSYVSLALDDLNNPHIVYVHNNDLKYAYNDGAWHFETIEGANTWGYTSISVRGSVVHISCIDVWNAKVIYYYGSSGAWAQKEADALESADGTACWTSIALDPLGNPFITFLDNTVGKLKYTYYCDGSWLKGTIDAGLTVVEAENTRASTVSVAIANDVVHVAYTKDNDHLNYATTRLLAEGGFLNLPPAKLISFPRGVSL